MLWYVLLTKYYSSDQIENNEIGGACSIRGGEERCTQGFGGEPEEKRPLGRARHRWEDNIKMDLQDVAWESMGCMDLAQDRDRWWALVNAVMNLQVPWNVGNFLTSWEPVSFWRRTLLQGIRKCGQKIVINTGPFTVTRSVCLWNFTAASECCNMWLKSCKLTKTSVDLEGRECALSQPTLMTKSENSPVSNPCQA